MGTKNKFTPGPWTLERETNALAMGGELNTVVGPKGAVCTCEEGDAAEARANAALISAAPELLEALESILSDNRLMNALSRDQARLVLDATAKARGEAL